MGRYGYHPVVRLDEKELALARAIAEARAGRGIALGDTTVAGVSTLELNEGGACDEIAVRRTLGLNYPPIDDPPDRGIDIRLPDGTTIQVKGTTQGWTDEYQIMRRDQPLAADVLIYCHRPRRHELRYLVSIVGWSRVSELGKHLHGPRPPRAAPHYRPQLWVDAEAFHSISSWPFWKGHLARS
jgi:hypothetical protein